MLEDIKLENILFLDIETVPLYKSFDEMPDSSKALWDKKSSHFRTEEQDASDAYERAGIFAEFGKIICISCGYFLHKDGRLSMRMKSFYGDDESELLSNFNTMLSSHFSRNDQYLCAHNGKEFDFPYIARRSLIHGLPLPKPLDLAGKKPWEVKHLDTMELWKFGDYKHYTPLNLLTDIFGIPTPKDDIDGSQVAGVYYNDGDLPRIVTYCQKDVIAVAQVLLRFKGEPLIEESAVEFI